MRPARTQIVFAMIALAGWALLSAPRALAEPMKCSNQEKTCAAACRKAVTGLSACLTACGARASYCMKTGCWNDGSQTFCGLNKR